MAIRKKDLLEFIESKASKRKAELREAVQVKVKDALRPVIYEMYKEMEPIERQAQMLYDKMVDLLEGTNYMETWGLRSATNEINNRILGFRNGRLVTQTNRALSNILDNATNGLDSECYPVVEAVEQDMTEQIARYKDHSKLTGEITVIIKASPNGNKAYDRLKELGVDLTGFEGSPANLPAVINLSSNVCIFNGDCK